MMHWMLSAAIRPLVLTMVFCGASVFTACSSNDDNPAGQTDVSAISDKVWAYSQTHPDGFTLDIRTMTEPTRESPSAMPPPRTAIRVTSSTWW